MRKALLILTLLAVALLPRQTEARQLSLPSESFAGRPRIAADALLSIGTLMPSPTIRGAQVTPLACELLDYARSFLGTRYRRGGKTPAGFDCSGFTGYVFRKFGYSLSASSAAQYSDAPLVHRDDIRPGDLLFFNGRSRGSRIGHVGIAIAKDKSTGAVTFIHSSTSGGVRVDRTDSPYYAARFVGASRVLPE